MEFKEKIAELDSVIGQKIRQRRLELRLSQSKLGEQLNVSFQQIQKYENGKNRVSASTLFQIARVLGVDFSYFFGEYDADRITLDQDRKVYQVYDSESTALINVFVKIQDAPLKKIIFDLVKRIANVSANSANNN